MVITNKVEEIGLRQGRQICKMSHKQRIDFIAEGLPIIFQSTHSLMGASKALTVFPREAEILEGHAVEECAKLLILVDIVRCPQKLVAARVGNMMRWFYDHLARLIYADAQSWVAYTPGMLQGYVDNSRPSHYLEGAYGEFIAPNWDIYLRESMLYSDIVGNEDTEPTWNSPKAMEMPDFLHSEPAAYRIADALDAVGALTAEGVKIMAESWGHLDFATEIPEWGDPRNVAHGMLLKLEKAGLISAQCEERHVSILMHRWQKPMYFIDFSPIKVSLEDLRKLRDANLYNEFL